MICITGAILKKLHVAIIRDTKFKFYIHCTKFRYIKVTLVFYILDIKRLPGICSSVCVCVCVYTANSTVPVCICWYNYCIYLFNSRIMYNTKLIKGVDKKNQLDVTFCILYFSSNSCSTCFGQPCAHHQELTTV